MGSNKLCHVGNIICFSTLKIKQASIFYTCAYMPLLLEYIPLAGEEGKSLTGI